MLLENFSDGTNFTMLMSTASPTVVGTPIRRSRLSPTDRGPIAEQFVWCGKPERFLEVFASKGHDSPASTMRIRLGQYCYLVWYSILCPNCFRSTVSLLSMSVFMHFYRQYILVNSRWIILSITKSKFGR